MKTAIIRLIVFFLCLLTSVGLLIASFILPPTGHIDPSVLQAGSLLLAFWVFYDLANTIATLRTFKVSKGDVSFEGETHAKSN